MNFPQNRRAVAIRRRSVAFFVVERNWIEMKKPSRGGFRTSLTAIVMENFRFSAQKNAPHDIMSGRRWGRTLVRLQRRRLLSTMAFSIKRA